MTYTGVVTNWAHTRYHSGKGIVANVENGTKCLEEAYRFGDCFFRRAFPPVPTFRLSLTRASTLKSFLDFKTGLFFSLFAKASARDNPKINASSWPIFPPPSTLMVTAYFPKVFVKISGN